MQKKGGPRSKQLAKVGKPQRQRAQKIRKEKERTTQSANGFESIKQARGDPRMGKNGLGPSVLLSTQQNAVTVQVETQNENIWNFAMGYVTKALERGFQALDASFADPYSAYCYLVTVLSQFAAGGVPAVQKLPYVVLAFGRALTQKSVRAGNGKVAFAFVNANPAPPQPTQIVGYQPYGRKWTIGYVPPAPTLVNGFPQVITAGLVAPDEPTGQAAFSEMNQFLIKKDTVSEDKSDFRLVDLKDTTVLDRDVAVFCTAIGQLGGGSSGTGVGGYSQTSQLEVPIFRPYLSVFNANNASPFNLNRFSRLSVQATGDPTWLGASMGHFMPKKWWGMQRYPKLHQIDFNEFLNVLALYCQRILQAAMNDPTGQSGPTPPTYACPLTLQEVGLLLRNVMMTAFKDTQAAVQGLFAVVPASVNDNQFQAFVASSATCFLQAIDMHLPKPFLENIKALVYRIALHNPWDPEMFIPVLGMMAKDQLDESDYTYTPPGGSPIKVFKPASAPIFRRLVFDEIKNEKIWKDFAETPINYIDGSYTSGFAAINNPQQLQSLAMRWNDWLATNNLTSYSVGLGTFNTDPGPNVMFSGNMTRHWTPVSQGSRKYKKKGTLNGELVFEDVRLKTSFYKSVTLSPYVDRLAICDTAQSPILQAVYENVQQNWILPTILQTVFAESGSDFESSDTPRWQNFMGEHYLQVSSSGVDGVSLAEKHASYAAKLTKSKLDAENDWTVFFDEMDKTAKGGILSGLVGGALSALFPKAASTINAIADVVPF